MTANFRLSVLGLALLALASTACSRGADETRLRTDVQDRLNRDVKPDLFEVASLRRAGSSPLPAGESGATRVLVYYNASLKLKQDYAFGGWDQLSPASLAFALGANEKGLFGLQSQNRAGDVVRAYGSAIYEQAADGWKAVASIPSGKQAAKPEDVDGMSLRSKQLIDQLAAMVNIPPPGPSPVQDEIIADELARASQNIERRVQRREHTYTIATGPEDGDYTRFGEALIAAVNQAAPNVKLRQRTSDGSVENARLLSTGEADYAFIQGDVAAAALAGEGVFAPFGAIQKLRAVGALFPEAIHVVVLPKSPVRDVSQLRGKRVNLGAPSSGTRFDALAVLEAYGMTPADLADAGADPVSTAIGKLKKGQLDALFVTAPAPTRLLQELAVTSGMRLLSIGGDGFERLARTRPGLSALTLPANTYPQQREPLATIGSSTLLVTTSDAPVAEVANVSDLVFRRMQQVRGRSPEVVGVSNTTELRGVTIPLHPGVGQKTQ